MIGLTGLQAFEILELAQNKLGITPKIESPRRPGKSLYEGDKNDPDIDTEVERR